MNIFGLKLGLVEKALVILALCALSVGAFPGPVSLADTDLVVDTELVIDGQSNVGQNTDTASSTEFEFDIDGEATDVEIITVDIDVCLNITDIQVTIPDGFYVEGNSCYPIAAEESVYVIDGYKYECQSNDEVDSESTWECSEPVEGWRIYATNGVDEVSTTTDSAGYYSLTVPAGSWVVEEEARDYWYQVLVVENDSIYADYEYCEFNFSEESSESLDDSAPGSDADASCIFGNWHPTYKVSGVKWNDRNSNGFQDEDENGVAGWKIYAQDRNEGGGLVEATTDQNGNYQFNLALAGDWNVYEEMRTGWNQVEVIQNDEKVIDSGVGGLRSCEFNFNVDESAAGSEQLIEEFTADEAVDLDADGSFECSFYNHFTPVLVEEPEPEQSRRSGGSSGTLVTNRATPAGLVLGASSSAPACGMYLTDYMRMGSAASSTQVTKLQMFLNAVAITTPLTGIFDAATDASVRTFQSQHKAEVLTPWYMAKLALHENPTGWVYRLTRFKINNTVCPGSEAYPVLN